MDVQRTVSGGAYCGNQVARAIRRGELRPAATCKCVDCDGPARDYDHRDYNRPLAVEPVCRSCNGLRGKAVPREWADGELFKIFRRHAARLRIVPWAVEFCWRRAERCCARIEQATNGGLTRHDLRPDLFGPACERLPQKLAPNPYA